MFGGDFDGTRKPAGEGAIEERVADEKHEENGEKGDSYCANDHFGFEAGAELLVAAFRPEAKNSAKNNEKENYEHCRDEAGNSIKRQVFAPVAWIEGSIEGP